MALGLMTAPVVAAADANVAPTVSATVSNANPVEGQTVVASATFTDPESATETYTCSILYGDGTPMVAGVVSGLTCTGPEHRYLVTGGYGVLVTVTDSGGASGAWLAGVNYTNQAPGVGQLALVGAREVGVTLHAVAPFLDYGSAFYGTPFETYSCTIDYGDGTPAQAGTYVTLWTNGFPTCIGPDHVYQKPGTFTIAAVVTDSGGAAGSGQLNATITAPVSPTVTAPADQTVTSLQAAPYNGYYPYSLGTFVDPNGQAAGPWHWNVDWGDGTSASGTATSQGALTASHLYWPGTHRASTTVTNAAGWSGSASFNATVAGDVAVGVYPPSQMVNEGVPATVNVYFYDPYPSLTDFPFTTHMAWGDGTFQDVSTSTVGPIALVHTYAAGDRTYPYSPMTVYNASATVTDAQGHTGSSSATLGVVDIAPVVTPQSATVPPGTQVRQITLATFTDASVGPWYVSIDGGADFKVQEQLAAPGPIQVPYSGSMGDRSFTVTVGDRGGLLTTVTTQVRVVSPYPIVTGISFTPSPALEGSQVAVVATYTQTGGDYLHNCSVDYGDGSGALAGSISGSQCYGPGHLYTGLGPYTVTVTVAAVGMGSGSGQATLTLANDPPAITSFTITDPPTAGEEAFAMASFADRGLGGSETYSCTVDYGDGSGPERATIHNQWCYGPGHFYAHTGAFTIGVAITDSHGGTGTASRQIVVQAAAPVVSASVSDYHPTEPETVIASATFTQLDSATETYTCTIDYGDGTVVPGLISGTTCTGPANQYTVSSYYTIEVDVTDGHGQTGYGYTEFYYQNTAPRVVGLGLVGYLGVGSTSHAVATVVDPGQGIESYDCTIDYGDGSASQYGTWVPTGWSDGLPHCVFPDHVYSAPGAYTLTSVVTDSGGESGSAQYIETIAPNPPTVQVVSSQSGVEGQSPMSITAAISQPGVSGGSYTCQVDFGDGLGWLGGTVAGDTCAAASYSPEKAGTFTVTVSVTDSYGETGQTTASLTVANQAPVVSLYDVPSPWETGRSFAARVTFTDPGSEVWWSPETYTCSVDYGDGTGVQPGVITTNYGNFCAGPAHAYASKGTYTFVATVTDSNGATGTYSQQVLAYNQSPTIGAVSAPATNLAGAAVTASAFYDATGLEPADTCTVDYGDGTGALAATANGTTCTGPSHMYTTTGTFTIKVTILAGNGFTASASTTIRIYTLQVGTVSVSGPLTEGSSVTASAGFTPVGSQTYKCSVDYGDGGGAQTGTISGTTCKGPSHKYGRPGTFTISISVTGSKGNTGSSSTAATISNVMPVFGCVTLPSTAKIGSSVTVSASFTDPGTAETYQVVVDWNDGTRVPITLAAGVHSFSASHTYKTAGDYPVVLELSDDQMAHVVTSVPVIAIYDPARTLTGSGTFASPAGACVLSSKCGVASTASFVISASYPKGATKPTATFTFSVTGLSFTATSFDWYMVTNGTGVLYGSGKVNGASGYHFTVFTVDGSPDKILVNIVGPDGFSVYYNNDYTPLKTGSIVMK
jgi:hypothetical protein